MTHAADKGSSNEGSSNKGSSAETRQIRCQIRCKVNGDDSLLPSTGSLADLLAQLGLTGQRVAVECNGHVVPRSLLADTHPKDGDRIEIVRAIGGG